MADLNKNLPNKLLCHSVSKVYWNFSLELFFNSPSRTYSLSKQNFFPSRPLYHAPHGTQFLQAHRDLFRAQSFLNISACEQKSSYRRARRECLDFEG